MKVSFYFPFCTPPRSPAKFAQLLFHQPETHPRLLNNHLSRSGALNLLLRSAWQALSELLEETFGIESAAAMMLHTWNQRMEAHGHVHAIVPGGGPSLVTGQWIKTRHPRHRRRKEPYLVDNIELGKRFRETFIAGCKRLHAKDGLKLEGEWSRLRDAKAFATWLESIAPQGWVVYIEPPPSKDASPQHVLKYLARYLTGGPISDRRLISYDGRTVRFWARSEEKRAAGASPSMVQEELPAVEFVRRWSLHILPKGFMKVRHYGGFSNTKRKAYLARCREALGLIGGEQATRPAEAEPDVRAPCDTGALEESSEESSPPCPHCGQAMRRIASRARPSWRTIFCSGYRPPWYPDP